MLLKIHAGMLTHVGMQNVLLEISQMAKLSHPNVMSLLGVCTAADQGSSIVMPYMANGSLLDYLKRERKRLYVAFDAEPCTVSLILSLQCAMICHFDRYLVLGNSLFEYATRFHLEWHTLHCRRLSTGI